MSGWTRVKKAICDLCACVAVWEHPHGGKRCDRCPRPEGSEHKSTAHDTEKGDHRT